MIKLAYFDEAPKRCLEFSNNLKNDFSIITETNPLAYSKVLSEGPLDAIIIDMDMPTLDGFQLFEKIQDHIHYNGCPIIFMTDDDSDRTTLFALQMGAEEVIHHEWSAEIVAERVNQRIQRYLKNYIYQLGNLRIDKKRYKVTLNNKHVELSLTEFKLVCLIISKHPGLIDFDELVEAVWASEVDEKNLHTHMSNLRKKLRDWTLTFKTQEERKIGVVSQLRQQI